MPKDYVHRSNKSRVKKRHQKQVPWRIILFVVTILCMLIGSIIYITNHKTTSKQNKITQTKQTLISNTTPGAVVTEAQPVQAQQNIKNLQKNIPQNKPATTIATHNNLPQEPRDIKFDFYQMLPKMQVSINNNKSANNEQKDNSQYIIQLASFPNKNDALTFQKQMAKMNFKTKVTAVPQGQIVWYRAQIGPFKEKQKAEDIRDDLQKHDINCILIRIKNLN